MRRRTIALTTSALLAVSALAWGAPAIAQEAPWRYQPLPAPSNAFELKLGIGYTQGLGSLAPGQNIADVAGAGLGASMDLDYRMTPWESIGVEAQYQEFTTENNSGSRGLAANIGVTLHARPDSRGDPFLRIGAGYRLLWDVHPTSAPNTTNLFQGFTAITGKIGYDFRATRDIAIAPVIGADLQTFIWENSTTLVTTQLGTFLYAGLQGRFDAGGTTPSTTPIAKNY
jgi:hypothetical protein